MAVLVPMACEAVPIERPWDGGVVMRKMCRILKPKTEPKSPTQTTTAAVRGGMPPIDEVISMAIGVVTDLEAREITTSFVAPKRCESVTTDTIPIMHPTNCETIIDVICCFMDFRRR